MIRSESDVIKSEQDPGMTCLPCGWAGPRSEALMRAGLTRMQPRRWICPECTREVVEAWIPRGTV